MQILRSPEFWLKAVAIAAAVVGVAARCFRAATLGFNADEALHLLPVFEETLFGAVSKSVVFHHPPLLIVLTYFIRPLIFEEFGARLIPILAGSLLPVVLYFWLRERLGLVAASTAAVVAALSPNLITLSPQIRSYSLAIFFAALVLLWLDLGIDTTRLSRIVLSGLALTLAILSDYSVAIVCPAITLYGIARLHESSAPRRLWVAWAVVVMAALATFGLLYWLQIRHFSEDASDFAGSWLSSGFRAPDEPVVLFLARASLKQFAYLAGSSALGLVLAAGFALALPVSSLAWRILLLTPFVTGLVLSLLQLLPFGRTRHSAIMSIVIAAGLALAAHHWLAFRPRTWLAATTLLAILGCVIAQPDFMDRPDSQLDARSFRAAASYAGTLTPRSVPILATGEARLLIQVYRAMTNQPPIRIIGDTFGPLNRQFFERHLAGIRPEHGTAPITPVYFVDAGYFPVEFPEPRPGGPLRRFGLLSVWRVSQRDSETTPPIAR